MAFNSKRILLFLISLGAIIIINPHRNKIENQVCYARKVPVIEPARHNNKEQLYTNITQEYASAIDITHSDEIYSPKGKQILKEYIMLHNEAYNNTKRFSLFSAQYKNRPYIQYKHLLDQRIASLEGYKKQLLKKDLCFEKIADVETLVNQLNHLKAIIITTDEYHQEKISLENNNLPRPLSIIKTGLTMVVGRVGFA